MSKPLDMEGSLPGGSAPASVDASKEDHILDVILFAEAFLRRALTYSSAKSMVAPDRYGAHIRSTTTSTPSKSRTRSPSSVRSSK